MGKIELMIGIGGPGRGRGEDDGEGEEMSEYEQGAQDMRDRCCALAEMYETGRKPSKRLSALIDALPLDERDAGPASKPSGAGYDANEAYDEEDES